MPFSIRLIVVSICFAQSLWAHSPYEITYDFRVNQENPTLTVHLTPKTALDLITHLHPELANQAVIRLADYAKTYTTYFNQHIHFQGNQQRTKLSFQRANLLEHDATLLFDLNQLPWPSYRFKCLIDCFTDIYQRPTNIVKLTLPKGQQTFFLNKDQREMATSVVAVQANTRYRALYLVMGSCLVVGVICGFLMKIILRVWPWAVKLAT